MANKDEEIKVRLSKEQKQLIKEIAKAKGITMTQLILDTVIPFVEKQSFNIEHKEAMEDRIEKTEGKLIKIKGSLKNSSGNNKNSWWKNMFT